MKSNGAIDFTLHNKQGLALLSNATEIGYGGARGGGKSHLARVSAIYFSYMIAGLQTFFFRRLHNELIKNHMDGPTGFRAMLANWAKSGFIEIVKDEIRFKNGPHNTFDGGSRIFLCHCQHEKDVFNWLGPEMHYLILEQAEQFTEFMIRMLRSGNRVPDTLQMPKQFEGLFPRCLYTFNPGGVGHAFFKNKFVKARRPMEIEEVPESEGGKRRQFIPARVNDNPSIDPVEYTKTLQGLPPKMVKALLEGDFESVIGAFFPNIDRARHLIRPFVIPEHWPRFLSLDWGACGDGDPFSLGWYTITDGTHAVTSAVTNEPILCQRGSLVCYRRWNGTGLPKVTAIQIAEGIKSRERGESILFRVAGGDILEQKGHGESIFSLFLKEGLHFIRADNRRQNGWAQVEYRFQGENDSPLSFWFEECADDLETIGSLQHDLHQINDTAKGDDHDADRHRYACMTRPLAKDAPEAVSVDMRDKNRRQTVSDLVRQIQSPGKLEMGRKR